MMQSNVVHPVRVALCRLSLIELQQSNSIRSIRRSAKRGDNISNKDILLSESQKGE